MASTSLLAAATAAIVVMAATASGFPVSHVSANDGGVWLTDNNPGAGFRGSFGEFDVPVSQLGYDFGDPGPIPQIVYDLDVLQEGATVIAVDRGRGDFYPVDSQTGTAVTSAGVALPAGGVVQLGGGVVAVFQPATTKAPSHVWAGYVGDGPTPALSAVNPASTKPVLTVPGGLAVAVDQTGDVFVASRTELVELPSNNGVFEAPLTTKFSQPLSSVAITTVGRTPVILDTAERVVHLPQAGLATTLPPAVGSGPNLVLQQPGPTDTAVLLATRNTLVSVPLSGQAPTVLASVASGVPAAPVSLDGCAYSAWAASPGQTAEICGSGTRLQGPLPGGTDTPASLLQPVFRVNHNEIVLNDTANGNAWQVAGRPAEVLTNQDWLRALVSTNPTSSKSQQNSTASNPAVAKKSPKLDNPTLYARAGHQSILHLLDFDTDPGGSILSITSITPTSGPGYSVSVSPDTQTAILSLQSGVTTPVTFRYQVVDGFGLTASGPVTVDPTIADKPPAPPTAEVPIRPVVSGATVSMQVLANWRDPQNGTLSLASATVPGAQGQLSWTSDGLITFSAANEASDTPVIVTYSVTDGYSPPVSGKLQLLILGRGDLKAFPATGVPDAAQVIVGKVAVLSPLSNDIFGADPADPSAKLALAGPIAPTAGLTVTTDVNSGTVSVTATRSGVYSLTYRDAFGSTLSAPTQILIQAVEPAGSVQPPITSPVGVILHGQYPVTVDVLSGDYDPAGGLLTVISASAPTGYQATVVDGEYLRLVTTSSAPPSRAVIDYQVTDGLSSAVAGQVDVSWQPASTPTPPFVPDTFATVRAGDAVSVAVLAAATDPDGESVHLLSGGTPSAVTLSATTSGSSYTGGLGYASISGGYLLYSAPSPTGITSTESITASYTVESQNGERTTGHTLITVVPDIQADTTSPQPPEVDARVTAGGKVTIPIPTSGVDPDGDSVTVTGITSSPHLGQILSFNATSITYQAYPFAANGNFIGGTDSFSYQVEGPSGLTAEGEIRVGVSSPTQPQAPVAVDHFAVAAPGDQLAVNLLSGAVISSGDQVQVEPLSVTNHPVPATATLVGNPQSTLQVAAPAGADPTGVAYGITDGTASPSVAQVLVHSEPGYVIPPVASNYYPKPPAPTAKSVTVNVLAKDSDPGGTRGDLQVVGSPVPGVTAAGPDLVIPVSTAPRSIPYEIKSSSTGATAVGVVHVLGTDMGPQLKTGQVVHVPEGGHVTINIDDYVTEPGHSIRLTTTNEVSASPSGGLVASVNSNTSVTLTGVGTYVGPGALSVQVVDASTLSAKGAQTATFSIPVVVGNPTPVVRCPASPIDVVEGGPPVDLNISSACQVWTPDGSPPASVVFSEKWSQQAQGVTLGWQSGQTGHVISIDATSSAKPGTTGSVTVGVPGAGQTAGSTLSVAVIAAPLPTATPADPPPVQTGQTAVVNMAQYVSSPLAQPNIFVVSVKQTSGLTAPASNSGSVVRISPQSGTHGTLTYAVAVSDAGPTRPDRVVNDTITLQVLDVPGTPTNVQGVPGNDQVALSWGAAPANGAPVLHYVINMGGTSQQTAGTSYTWTGLTNGQSYSFTVAAVNQVGTGAPSPAATFSPRAAPGAPGSVSATTSGDPQGAATVNWSAANPNGQPITGYTVTVSPNPGGTSSLQVAGTQTSVTWQGLSDAIGPYTFSVVAHNSVGASPPSGASNAVYAHGVPSAPPAPTAAGQVSTDQSSTSVVVSWSGISDCNDAQPCASYIVTELRNGSAVATDPTAGACSSSSGLCATFGPISNDGSTYTYTLEAVNAEGQTSAASPPSGSVTAVGAPAQITNLSATPGNTQIGVTFTLPPSHGSTITQVDYNAAGASSPASGAWSNPGTSGQTVSETIPGLINGTTYSVTVEACNESAKCGPPSNTVSGANTDPYGTPYPPSVSASQSGDSIVYAWSGGGSNGRAVASYSVCIDNKCTNETSAASTTITYGCSSGPHSIYATVTDTAGQTSSNSVTATASTQTCSPPNPPTLSASVNGNTITWSWGGGGGNGLPISSYTLCPDTGCVNVGGSPGSKSFTFSCGQTHSAYAYVTDTIGQNSSDSSTVSATTSACPPPTTTTPPPSASIRVSWGTVSAPYGYGKYMSVTWTGFSTGTLTFYCDEGGTKYGPYSVKATSSPFTADQYTCYDATPGNTDYVITNGINSNTIPSD